MSDVISLTTLPPRRHHVGTSSHQTTLRSVMHHGVGSPVSPACPCKRNAWVFLKITRRPSLQLHQPFREYSTTVSNHATYISMEEIFKRHQPNSRLTTPTGW